MGRAIFYSETKQGLTVGDRAFLTICAYPDAYSTTIKVQTVQTHWFINFRYLQKQSLRTFLELINFNVLQERSLILDSGYLSLMNLRFVLLFVINSRQ